jgi:hypothetical protein
MKQTLLTEFRQILRYVKDRSYPYHPREPRPTPWRRYDMVQVNELPEVISLMGRLIDTMDAGMPAGRGNANPD